MDFIIFLYEIILDWKESSFKTIFLQKPQYY